MTYRVNSYIKAILLTILPFVLSSCGAVVSMFSSTSDAQKEQEFNLAYVGKTYSNIVTTFGAPDRVESDGQGGKILVFEKINTTISTDVDTHFGMFDPDYTTTQSTSKSYRHFFMDEDGVCYLVKTNQMLPGGKYDKRDKSQTKWIYIGSGIFASIIALLGFSFLC